MEKDNPQLQRFISSVIDLKLDIDFKSYNLLDDIQLYIFPQTDKKVTLIFPISDARTESRQLQISNFVRNTFEQGNMTIKTHYALFQFSILNYEIYGKNNKFISISGDQYSLGGTINGHQCFCGNEEECKKQQISFNTKYESSLKMINFAYKKSVLGQMKSTQLILDKNNKIKNKIEYVKSVSENKFQGQNDNKLLQIINELYQADHSKNVQYYYSQIKSKLIFNNRDFIAHGVFDGKRAYNNLQINLNMYYITINTYKNMQYVEGYCKETYKTINQNKGRYALANQIQNFTYSLKGFYHRLDEGLTFAQQVPLLVNKELREKRDQAKTKVEVKRGKIVWDGN